MPASPGLGTRQRVPAVREELEPLGRCASTSSSAPAQLHRPTVGSGCARCVLGELCGALAVGLARRRRRAQLRLSQVLATGCRAAAVGVETAPAEVREQRPQAPWLAEYLPKPGAGATSEELLLGFLKAMEDRGVKLYPAQEEAVVEIFSGSHVVLDTPTGSGKSLVAVAALFHTLGRGGKAFYTSPTKALTSEKFFDLCRYFGPSSVGMATGDVSLNTRAPLVCCTAEVLASIVLRDGPAANIDCVVMDEFHYFGDPARGVAWELPLWRLAPGRRARFLLMSGTLGDNSALYSALEEKSGRPVRVVRSTLRPVPLQFRYSGNSVKGTIEELVKLDRSPVYAVHFSQRESLETARLLATWEEGGKPFLAGILEGRGKLTVLQRALDAADFSSPFGRELETLLRRGVGVHHAGLLPRYRRLVEQLAQASLLALICGTDTLGVGVNVPIRSVLFTRLCKYDGKEVKMLPPRDFHQIAGRAGRKGFDDRGDVVAVDPDWVVYNREMKEQLQKGLTRSIRWKRPPQKGYKHWTEASFKKLQTSPAPPLRSQFRLSMGQVLAVLDGAVARGQDGAQELEELISSAQCTRGERRYWRRQVQSYVAALQRSLQPAHADAPTKVIPEKKDKAALGAVEKEAAAVSETRPGAQTEALPLLSDNSSLFVYEVLGWLQARVNEEDLPFAIVAAAEAVCDVTESLQRLLSSSKVGRCPEHLQDLLHGALDDLRRRYPWFPRAFLRPKGLALELLQDGLSFEELLQRIGKGTADGVTFEGALLRYLSEVYRALRCSVPKSLKSSKMKQLEAGLRAAVLSVDSSLVREWEALKEMEEASTSLSPASVQKAEEASELPSGDPTEGWQGAMVPKPSSETAPRSTEQLQAHVAALRAELDQRWAAEKAAQSRSIKSRVLRLVSKVLDIADGLWGSVASWLW